MIICGLACTKLVAQLNRLVALSQQLATLDLRISRKYVIKSQKNLWKIFAMISFVTGGQTLLRRACPGSSASHGCRFSINFFVI